MFRKFMVLAGVVGMIIGMAVVCGAVQVDGYCFLGGQTNHSGIKVLFQADSPGAVTDSTYTNSQGYYYINLAPGYYDVNLSFSGFGSEDILNQNCFLQISLPDITLYIHISIPFLSGIITRNPYVIDNTIFVQSGTSLVIEPGVTFLFDGSYSFIIIGSLFSIGSQQDSIRFIPKAGIDSWAGIAFGWGSMASDSSQLAYCYISGSNSAAIYCENSSPIITHSTIFENSSAQEECWRRHMR